jgi:small-conductance mechanosensitive channel
MTPLHIVLLKPMLPEPDRLSDIGIRIGLTIAVAFVVQRLLFLLVGRIEKFLIRSGHGSAQVEQRAHTLSQIFRSLITVVVIAGAIIHSLAVMGWNVGPLLAGAGILGVALGFGAQTLVRDVIAGVFILAEDQFSVGDLIELDGKAGTVEALTVRCTTLRDFYGYVHFVPNGEMKIVVNRSRGWNRLAVDVQIAPDQDIDRALDACRRAADALNADPEWKPRLLDPVEVWGVESLGAQGAQVRLVVRSRPGGGAAEASRALRRLVHRALAEAGVRTAVAPEISITALGPAEAPIRGSRAG